MKIFVNALSVTSGGGLICLRDLLPEWEKNGRGHRFVIIAARSQQNVLADLPAGMGRIILPLNHKNIPLRLLWEQFILPWMLLFHRADWLYALGNQAPILSPCNVLLLIENANPFSLLDLEWTRMERLRNSVLLFISRLAARRATRVRFLSRNSRDIISARLRIPLEKTIVVPHGIRREPVLANQQGLTSESPAGPSILIVTNVGPHKNLGTCIEAFDQMVRRKHFTGDLLVVGEILYREYFLGLERLLRERDLEQRVQFVGWKSGEELAAYYRAATVFVFPSVEETFGLPVFEAMMYGIPVVVPRHEGKSDMFLPFEELCGDGATYFDPFDPESLANALNGLLEDPVRRATLVERGQTVISSLRWERTAQELLDTMEKAAKE